MKKIKPFLIESALGTGKILMKYLNKAHKIERKEDQGIVTEADKAAENYLLKRIFKEYPQSSVLTEESGEFKKSGTWTWVIDPLDGTTNYAHGFPWFCVSIGLYDSGNAVAGVVYNPVSKEMFFAEKGKGAFLNGKRIRVSKTKNLKDALLGTGFYYSKGQTLIEEIEIFTRMNEAALGVRRPGAAALDLAYVACGRYDAFWERRLSSWDVAAGMLMVKEAGGKISNYSGGETDMYAGEIIASNGHLHRRMVNLIQKSLIKRKRPS
jgi:myo-inositol-1(or 4)-monophosphatase